MRFVSVLFTWTGMNFQSEVLIPSNVFRPISTTMSFDARIPELALRVTLPRWNTHALRSPELLTDVGRVREVLISGSYQYHSEVREEYLDQLKLQITVSTDIVAYHMPCNPDVRMLPH